MRSSFPETRRSGLASPFPPRKRADLRLEEPRLRVKIIGFGLVIVTLLLRWTRCVSCSCDQSFFSVRAGEGRLSQCRQNFPEPVITPCRKGLTQSGFSRRTNPGCIRAFGCTGSRFKQVQRFFSVAQNDSWAWRDLSEEVFSAILWGLPDLNSAVTFVGCASIWQRISNA